MKASDVPAVFKVAGYDITLKRTDGKLDGRFKAKKGSVVVSMLTYGSSTPYYEVRVYSGKSNADFVHSIGVTHNQTRTDEVNESHTAQVFEYIKRVTDKKDEVCGGPYQFLDDDLVTFCRFGVQGKSAGPNNRFGAIQVVSLVALDEIGKIDNAIENPSADPWFKLQCDSSTFIISDGEIWYQITNKEKGDVTGNDKLVELHALDKLMVQAAIKKYVESA